MTTPSASPGFKVPFNIPGAPERTTISELVDTAKPLVQNSLDNWMRKPGAFETSLSQASWWHFWVLVGIAVLVSAIGSALNLLIIDGQLRGGGCDNRSAFVGCTKGERGDTRIDGRQKYPIGR